MDPILPIILASSSKATMSPPFKHVSDAFILNMFYTVRVFETPFFRSFNVFYRVLVVPPPEPYDHIIFACVRNLAGDHRGMAIGTDL